MHKIKRIGVVSSGKIAGLIYAIFGLIIGALISLVSIGGTAMTNSSDALGLGVVFGVGSIIALPIFYGVIGFISGVIGAAIYNLAARWIGGIEIEVETVATVVSPTNTIAQ